VLRELLKVSLISFMFGEPVLMLFLVLKAETETCMRLLGVEKVSELGPKHVSLFFPLHAWQKLMISRSTRGLSNEMSMMGMQAWRSLDCGCKRSYRRVVQ
jgi:hypothetical protein